MPYAELLTKLIDDKGLTIKEVAERCSEQGKKITAAYISILKNPENKKTPSDDISRALAGACEAQYENCLVIEAYVDKAPEEFKVLLDTFRNSIMQSMTLLFSNNISEEEMVIILSKLKAMPMYEFIALASSVNEQQKVSSSKSGDLLNITTTMTEDNLKVIAELKQPEGFKVNDNAMEPLIPNGCMIFLEILELINYKNGDIILVKVKNSKAPIVRKCIFNNDKSTITLFAYNNQVEPQTLIVGQVSIIGKVKRIITDL